METEDEKQSRARRLGEYLANHIQVSGIRQAEIARRSNLSPQVISVLVNRKPHHLTGKLMLPERETIDAIADAIGRPRVELRAIAGYLDDNAEQTSREILLDCLHKLQATQDAVEKLNANMVAIAETLKRLKETMGRDE